MSHNTNIFLVDDHPIVRNGLKALIERLGNYKVTGEYDNGEELMNDYPFSDNKPDLIIMDLMMPVMAGTEATRAIRALEVPWSNLPIIAFTAGAFEHDREDARSSGMAGFLEKPVRLNRMREVLLEHLGPAS